MKETVDLKDLLNIVRKRFRLISFFAILAVLIAAVLSFLVIKPVYQASTEILVNQSAREAGQLTDQNIRTDLQLINTYSGIIKSPAILDQVVEQLKLDITAEELNEEIAVSNLEESQIITVSVQDGDPATAVEIANTTAAIFENDIKELMNIDNVSILSPAIMKENQEPVAPAPMLYMLIASVIGLILGVGAALLLEYFDASINNQQDVEEYLNIPFLGVVSPIDENTELVPDSKVTTHIKAVYE